LLLTLTHLIPPFNPPTNLIVQIFVFQTIVMRIKHAERLRPWGNRFEVKQCRAGQGKATQRKAWTSETLLKTPVKPTAVCLSIYFGQIKRKFSVGSILLYQLRAQQVCGLHRFDNYPCKS
jgi:hypothetical protein